MANFAVQPLFYTYQKSSCMSRTPIKKCVGEKKYFLGDMNQEWSRWNGIHYYEDGKVKGEFQISED